MEIFMSVFLLVISVNCVLAAAVHPQKIAIVGGGLSGTSSSYFLRELFGDDVTLDLYEEKEIGGRLTEITVDGRPYEAGGTIIHPDNWYMVNFTKYLGLEQRKTAGGRLGMYDGTDMFFAGSEWDLMLMVQFLWRYGWDMYRIMDYIQGVLKDFSRIYEHQDQGFAFTTVEKLARSMSPHLEKSLHRSFEEDLRKYGFGETFIDELAVAALRTNYGQTKTVHAFVGGVCLAGVMPGLWKVKGGNKQVPEGLLKLSKANLIRSSVMTITKQGDKYRIQETEGQEREYDLVILATPLNKDTSNIDFINFPKPVGHFPDKFHRTVATFVKAWPNITSFGYEEFRDFPTEILTTNTDVFFNSIGRQTPVDFREGEEPQMKDAPVYKIFSQVPLTDEQIHFAFSSVKDKEVVDWLAYPHYHSNEKDIPPFKLDERMYYVNAIEWAASAMELSIIGARNVALLAHSEWFGYSEKIDANFDPMDTTTTKTEL